MSLEKEFKKLLQSKIDTAGKLLKEVNKLLEEKGENFFDLTQDYGLDENDNDKEEDEISLNMYPVINQLSNGGWATSSMEC